MESFLALILWCAGVTLAIIAIAMSRSRSARRGRGDPFAFLAIICSILIVMVLATVWAHYGRVDFIALIIGLLPGIAGVFCLVASRPGRH